MLRSVSFFIDSFEDQRVEKSVVRRILSRLGLWTCEKVELAVNENVLRDSENVLLVLSESAVALSM